MSLSHILATTMSKKLKSETYTWAIDESTEVVTKTDNASGASWSWKVKHRPSKARCNPSNNVSIQKIHEAGHNVRVRHLRWAYYLASEEKFNSSRRHAPRAIVIPSAFRKDPFYHTLPKGGYTHITIKTKRGDYICVSSECSKEDPFCYTKGVEKALERLSKLELNYLGV